MSSSDDIVEVVDLPVRVWTKGASAATDLRVGKYFRDALPNQKES
jgi:hypothetical protein